MHAIARLEDTLREIRHLRAAFGDPGVREPELLALPRLPLAARLPPDTFEWLLTVSPAPPAPSPPPGPPASLYVRAHAIACGARPRPSRRERRARPTRP